MASNIKFKRSAVQNRVPTTAQLDLGELALNTYDGKLYTEINTGSAAVIEIGSKLSSLVVDGANGAGGGDVVFHGTTAGRDLTWDYSANYLRFNDNAFATFGNSDDLYIYHDGNHSQIRDVGTGHLIIGGTHLYLTDGSGSEYYLQAIANNQVDLYHNNNIRITTTDDGADISGTGSLKIPVGTTAQRNSSPTNGDLRYNTTTGGFEGYSNNNWGELGAGGIGVGSDASNPRTGIIQNRIGVGFTDLNIVGAGISVTGYGTTVFVDFNEFKPGSFHRTIHNYTATAGQTTFAGLNYENGEKQIAVYLNGARLSEATYTATSGTTVVLDVGASLDDEVEIINIHTNSDVDRKVNTYTATAGQTTFTGLSYNSKTELDVYLNGIRLASDDFTATSGTTVVLAVGASVNDTVDIVSTGDGVSFRSTTDASGDRFTLSNVGIGQDTTPNALNVTGNVKVVGVLTATTLHGDGINLTNTGSSLSEPSSGTHRLVTTSLTSGTMTSSGTDSTLSFNYGTHTLAATNFSGNGASLTNLNASNLASGTVPTARLGSGTASSSTFLRGDSTFAVVDTALVADTSPQLGGNLDVNTKNIVFGDSAGASDDRLVFGAGSDLSMYHDGTNSSIDNNTAALIFRSDQYRFRDKDDGDTFVNFIHDGAVELYYDNTKRFETTSTGVTISGANATGSAIKGSLSLQNEGGTQNIVHLPATGKLRFADNKKATFGNSDDLEIYHSTNNIIQSNGLLLISSDNTNNVKIMTKNQGQNSARFIPDGAAELYHSGSKKFETTSTGASVTGNLSVSGVLTYEDVTSIDAVGIITAQQGIQVTSGDITMSTAGNIVLGDSGGTSDDRIVFGASSDLQIYHNGNESKIEETGTGGLRINTSRLMINNGDQSETMADFSADGAVELYHNNSKKFETLTNGAKVTGRLGIDKNPDTRVEVKLSVFTATGNDDASDWGADGIFQLTHSGTQAAGSEVLLLGAASGAVGQIASGFGFGRESTSNWGTYISFKTHSTGTSNIDELIERWRITSAGHLENNSDTGILKLGASDDLQIYHNGTNSFIENSTGSLYIRDTSGGDVRIQGKSGEDSIICHDDGQVELFFDNSKKLETVTGGVYVYGDLLFGVGTTGHLYGGDNDKVILGSGSDFQIYHDGNNSYITNNTNYLYVQSDSVSLAGKSAGQNYLVANLNGAVSLHHSGNQKLATSSTGVTVTGELTAGSAKFTDDGASSPIVCIKTDDQSPWAFSMGNDSYNTAEHAGLQFYQANSGDCTWHMRGIGSYLNMSWQSSNNSTSQTYMKVDTNRAVGLYYQGSQKLITKSAGVDVTGQIVCTTNFRGGDDVELSLGDAEDLKIFHDGTNSNIRNTLDSGRLDIRSDTVHISDNDNTHDMARFNYQGSVQLYHNYNEKFATTSYGVLISGNVQSNTIYPSANNSYDLGTTSTRWRNIYTNDLNLSNEGSTNDVDGTWGSYTIQEGEDDLFLINKRNGKKYKFNLTEVS